MQKIIDSLLSLNPEGKLEARPDGVWLEAPGIDVVEMTRRMLAGEACLSTITAVARADGETDLIYHYRLGSAALNVRTRTRGSTAPSIAPICRAADWIEREIQDLYAVTFTGHPNPARLIRPPEIAVGFFREPGGKNASQP